MSDLAISVAAWVRKAESDLTAVDLLIAGNDPPWDIVVFHAQQAAEKFLCAFLSPLAVLSRYPGDATESAREDAEKGVDIARRIRSDVLERLPAPGQ